MNDVCLLVQCGDMGQKWLKYFDYYYDKNWNCDDFIDTMFTFESDFVDTTLKCNYKNIVTGKKPWGQCMINTLNALESKYIILFHEDYFITDKPDKEKLKHLIEVMKENDMNLLKICGDWAGNTATSKIECELTIKENIYMYSKDGLYITSHQSSIWKKDYLLKTIKSNYNPWQHEIQGHNEAQKMPEIVHAYVGIAPIPYSESVTAGKPRPTCQHLFDIDELK